MKRGSASFRTALEASGLDCEIVELPDSTRSAKEAAAAIGCAVGEIAKSIVFRGAESDRPVLVIAAGHNRIDEAKVAAALGESIAKADADFVRAATGFAIGGVPPFGLATPAATFVDRDLLELRQIWAAAGTPHSVLRMLPDQLVEVSGATVIDVKQM